MCSRRRASDQPRPWELRSDDHLTLSRKARSVPPSVIAGRTRGGWAPSAVDTASILGANPVYDAPVDLGLAAALSDPRTPLRIHLGLYQDETADSASGTFRRPISWKHGAIVALDGTVTIQ